MKDEQSSFEPQIGVWCITARKRLRAAARESCRGTGLPLLSDADDLAQVATMVGVDFLRQRLSQDAPISRPAWAQLCEEAFKFARKSLKNRFLDEVKRAAAYVDYTEALAKRSNERVAQFGVDTLRTVDTPHDILVGQECATEIKRLSSRSKSYAELAVIAAGLDGAPATLADIAEEAGVSRKLADDWRRMLLRHMKPKGEK